MLPSLKFKLLHTPRGITIGMALLQLVKGILSLILVMLSASFFGAGIYRDAWVIAWSVQILVFKFMFGPINETFRAKFLQIENEKGIEIALNDSFALLLFFCVSSLIIAVAFIFFSNYFVSLFAPGYVSLADRQIIGGMLQYLMPTLILSNAITLFIALLNTFKTFYLPEIYGVFSVLVNIVLLYFFAPRWGIYTLVVANYISAIILLIFLVYFIYKRKYFPRNLQISFQRIKPFLLFAMPLYFFYAASQINSWSERIIVSYLDVGNNSALDYARKFIDFPNSVIFILASAVMAPILARLWLLNKNDLQFQKELFVFLRTSILLLSPVMVLFIVCPTSIVELLLYRGKFTHEWVAPITQTLFWFGMGLLGNIFFIISGQLLLVQQRAKLYALLGALAQLIPVIFNALFIKSLGIQVFGITWCISQLFFGLIMLQLSNAYNKNELKRFLRFISLCVLAIVFSYLTLKLGLAESDFFKIVLSLGSYLLYFLLLMILFGLEEIKMIKNLFTRK